MYDIFDKEMIKEHIKEIVFKFGTEEENSINSNLDMYVSDRFDLENLLSDNLEVDFKFIEELNSIEYKTKKFEENLIDLSNKSFLEKTSFNNLLFNYDDILDYTHFLYNHYYSEDIKNKFNYYFNKKNGSLIFKKGIRSYSMYLESVDQPYLILEIDNTISDLIVPSHEYGHVICEATKKRDYFEFPFIEAFSYLAEQIALDHTYEYFEEITKEDAISCKRWYFNNILKLVNNYLEFKDKVDIEYYAYSLSYLLSIELYYDYLKDPDKCFYKYFSILKSCKTNYPALLKKYNIHLNSHLKAYIKTIS